MSTRKPTRAELIEALKMARLYLDHPDVQAIPFALSVCNVVRMIDRATRSK